MPSNRGGRGAAAVPTNADGAQAALKELGPGRFRLQGALDLSAVSGLAKQGAGLLENRRRKSETPSARRIEIDLGGVERSSSAVIALLLDWVDKAARQQTEIVFTNWPQALVRIAAFSNVDGLLGIDGIGADDNMTRSPDGTPAWTSS